ncbi:MAG: peptide chain release factor N(5)-glutamine methyltransferase [Candidatus Omnitrophica bacterium]|nr:peptide chain release factor N(5)-glutamine methyltransferase [Candidatus Omnitrophota bacterium]
MDDNFKIPEILNLARKQLADFGFDSSRADAELILSFVLNCSRSDLYLKQDHLKSKEKKRFEELLKRRVLGEPVQYLTNRAYFFGLEFYVEPGVLIPRPETEILVQTVLDRVRPLLCPEHQAQDQACILDIGAGAGNISIALTKNQVSCKIATIDISKKAIDIGLKNAKKHNVGSCIEFRCFDCDNLKLLLAKEQLKLIVSNPPYIPSEDIDLLDKEVRREPRIALDGGGDGLKFYCPIIKQAGIYLKVHGCLVLEIGQDQAEDVTALIQQTGRFEDIEVIQDLNQRDRVVLAKRL